MLVVGTLVLVVLAGCGWTQTDFDSGRSRADAFESKITAANAGSLEQHAFPLAPSGPGLNPPTLAAVVGNQIVTQQGTDVVAYDARNHLWDGAVPDASAPDDSLGITSISLSGDKVVAAAMGGSHGSYVE